MTNLVSRDSKDSPAPPIHVVYFDLGNVLLGFDHGIACRNLAALFGTDEATMRRFVFDDGLEDRYERGEIDTPTFHGLLCERFQRRPALSDVRLAAADIFHPLPATIAVVSQLKGAGYTTGILSNTCEAHWEFARGGRFRFLNDLFDHIVLSYEVKSMKPEPEIYRAAIEKAGCPAESIFFMDDRHENVAGARAAGIRAVHFEHGHRLAEDLRRHGLRFNF